METWDILDGNGSRTGKRTEKTAVLPEGQYHLGVDVWIRNEEGKYLIQKRSAMKKRAPGKWMATGGSVLSGESGAQAVCRETMEELGIDVEPHKLKLLLKIRFKDCINEVWLLKQYIQLNSVKLQPDEVSEVKWVSKEEIAAMIKTGEMANCRAEYLQAVFEEKELQRMLI